MQKQSFLAAIFHSIIWKVVGRGAGFFKHVVIAAAIGLTAQLDIFYMAAGILGFLVYTWGSLLDVLTVPQLVKAEKAGNTNRFRSIAGGMFILTTGASLLICLLVMIFRDAIAMLAIGFEPALQEDLADAFVWLAPVIFLHVPFRFLGSVLRAKRLFSPLYQAEAYIVVIVLACIILEPDHPHVLLWSLSIATVAGFVYLAAFSARHISIFVNPIDKTVLNVLRNAPSLLVLHSAQSVMIAVKRVYVSFLPVGSVSAMAYALVLATAIPQLFSIQSSFMTVAAEKSSLKAREDNLNDLFSLIIFLAIGATFFLVWTAQDLIAILFERGAFDSKDTATVKTALQVFAFIIAPTFLIKPLDQIFQIEKKIGIIVRRTLFGIFVSVILYSIALFVLDWGIFGLALAMTISNWLICILTIFGLSKIGCQIDFLRHCKWAAWLMSFITLACVVLYYIPDMGSFINVCIATITIGLSLFAAGLSYRGHEGSLLYGVIRRVLPKKMNSFLAKIGLNYGH
jgi:peptidoglycan biosynthesis protein MviN/MurJ (putative lipid II flippase)